MDTAGEKVKSFLMNYIAYIVVGIVSAVYIATSFISINETGKSIQQILADGGVVFFLGTFTSRLFELQGIHNGELDERVLKTSSLHEEIVNRTSVDIDELDDWCELENIKNYRLQRTKILARAGLKYNDCFDDDGVAKPFVPTAHNKKERWKQRRLYNKAVHLRLTYLNAGDLTSDGGRKQDPFYFGQTKAQYGIRSSAEDVVCKIGTVLIFGYYGAELIKEFNAADLIWKCLQIAIFFIMGVVKMMQAYMFMTGEYRCRIIKKIDILQKFEDYIKKRAIRKEENAVEKLPNNTVNTEIKGDAV